ncbi:MAG TPA: PDZ domain-containing protein [Burkholderiales bacterium]|nr:PDZ domain-containing protein [Burkholderiales bacterium]
MRALPLLAVLLWLVGCEAPPAEELRLVTLAGVDAGLSLRELPASALAPIGLSYGLAVVHAGEAAQRAGLRMGDVVYGIGREPVGSLEELSRRLTEHTGSMIGLLVRRGKKDFYVALELDREAVPDPWPGRHATDTLLRT